ncbi:PREDICTED: alpha-ketoglutarate-dependent dioxygenase alkB homolog 4-like isoform X2 [Priapulus caudatus]|uniref:Alpha-ketoglutarate-dependent dioxygenase alkB homolog 4-like isoform X2 n=1 Tax=Priapulus caudatus TaxID=37621 RepID=A0ABM1DQR3_PRICU|nr:PREDICTED: alpha-ketoglutarate-dependent dioxygenase alkB homolog 4-like isoform X2 [Priapulus caudatus]
MSLRISIVFPCYTIQKYMGTQCFCKGIRTCLVCETSKEAQRPWDEIEGKHFFLYCDHCKTAWSSNYNGCHKESISGTTPVNHSGWYTNLSGIILLPEFITEEEESYLLEEMEKHEWVESQSGRRKQDFGPKTNFKKKKVRLSTFTGLPAYSRELVRRLQRVDALAGFLAVEQCNLEYTPERGSAIDPHFDDFWLWGERLVSVNLVSDTVMAFLPDKSQLLRVPVAFADGGGACDGASSGDGASLGDRAHDGACDGACSGDSMREGVSSCDRACDGASLGDGASCGNCAYGGACDSASLGDRARDCASPGDGACDDASSGDSEVCRSHDDERRVAASAPTDLRTVVKEHESNGEQNISSSPDASNVDAVNAQENAPSLPDAAPIVDAVNAQGGISRKSRIAKIARNGSCTCVDAAGDGRKRQAAGANSDLSPEFAGRTPTLPCASVEVHVLLPRRSVLVMAGAARSAWKHCIHRRDVTRRRVAITLRELSREFKPGGREADLGARLETLAQSFAGSVVR